MPRLVATRRGTIRLITRTERFTGGLITPLKYLAPFAFLALLPIGAWLGGAWTFLAAVLTPLALVSLDSVFGREAPRHSRGKAGAFRWLPKLYILLQLAVMLWAAFWVARPQTPPVEFVGLCLSTGLTAGVFGFLAAHELVHSRDRRERALGLLFLASVFYMHFRIAHIHGHHRRAATLEDPASARLGEGLYAFWARSIIGQVKEAWAFEARRRQRLARSSFGLGNRMVSYVTIEILLVVAVALVSGRAILFVAATAAIAILLLETFNYVAHYGLVRRARADGRIETLGPQHSWNSRRRMNNAVLFNMGRHSDHHRRTARSFERLEPVAGETELPSGYAAAIVMALIPPLWRSVMDPLAQRTMATPMRIGRALPSGASWPTECRAPAVRYTFPANQRSRG